MMALNFKKTMQYFSGMLLALLACAPVGGQPNDSDMMSPDGNAAFIEHQNMLVRKSSVQPQRKPLSPARLDEGLYLKIQNSNSAEDLTAAEKEILLAEARRPNINAFALIPIVQRMGLGGKPSEYQHPMNRLIAYAAVLETEEASEETRDHFLEEARAYYERVDQDSHYPDYYEWVELNRLILPKLVGDREMIPFLVTVFSDVRLYGMESDDRLQGEPWSVVETVERFARESDPEMARDILNRSLEELPRGLRKSVYTSGSAHEEPAKAARTLVSNLLRISDDPETTKKELSTLMKGWKANAPANPGQTTMKLEQQLKDAMAQRNLNGAPSVEELREARHYEQYQILLDEMTGLTEQ